jgi:hypothetical protein
MLHEYHVIYSVPYYPQFHVTAVGLGMYYPWIRGHYCTVPEGTATAHIRYRLGYGPVSLGVESQWEREIFLFSKLCKSSVGPTQSSIQSIPGFFPRAKAAEARYHLVMGLRKNGATPLVPLCDFTVWAEPTWPFIIVLELSLLTSQFTM